MEEPAERVAVRGDDDGRIRRAVRSAGGRVVDAAAADAVAAVGERSVRDALLSDHEAPVLPVGSGFRFTPRSDVSRTLDRLIAGDLESRQHPVVSVTIDGDPVDRAAFDVALMTSEPARISEYALALPADPDPTFRADGVVVATPLGSGEYAAAAGGPVVDPETGLAVVPVAPFTTSAGAWVVRDRVAVTVERDANSVRLVVDGTPRETVPPRRPVRVAVDRTAAVLRLRGD